MQQNCALSCKLRTDADVVMLCSASVLTDYSRLVFSWLYFVDGKRHQLVMCMKDGSSDAVDVTGMTAVTNEDPVFGLAYDVSRGD